VPAPGSDDDDDDDVFYLFLQKQKSTQNYIPQGYFPPYEEEEVLFIGTQFSNLSTAMDTSTAVAFNGV
jgi:hypothetical protein